MREALKVGSQANQSSASTKNLKVSHILIIYQSDFQKNNENLPRRQAAQGICVLCEGVHEQECIISRLVHAVIVSVVEVCQ